MTSTRKRNISVTGVLCSLCLVIMFYAGNSYAIIVVDQQPVITGGFFDGSYSSVDSGVLNADDFTVSQSASLDVISWWGSSVLQTHLPNSFTVQLFSDVSGGPAVDSLYDFNTVDVVAQGDSASDITKFSLDVSSGSIELVAGAQYYLAVMNDNIDADWYWAFSDASSENWFRGDVGDPWSADMSGNFAMMLEGTVLTKVPEPGTMFLALLPMLYLFTRKVRA